MADDVGRRLAESGDTFTRHLGTASVCAAAAVTTLVVPYCMCVAFVAPLGGWSAQAWAAMGGWAYHQVARALGGHTTRESSTSAAYYASAALVPSISFALAVWVAAVAWEVRELLLAVSVVALAGMLWHVALLRAHAVGQHGLSSARATLAAATPLAATLLFAAAVWAVLASGGGDLFLRVNVRDVFGW